MLISKTINSALRILGVLGEEEEATPAQAQDALDALNGMIEAFTNENLMINNYQIKTYTEPVGGWSNVLEIGTGKTINEEAPVSILELYNVNSAGEPTKIEQFSFSQWVDTPDKDVVTIPTKYCYETGIRSLILYLDSIPQELDAIKAVVKMPFSTEYALTDDITWDYGYERMIRYNLAIELASEYGRSLNESLVAIAQKSKKDIKVRNSPQIMLNVDKSLRNPRGFISTIYG